MVGMGVFWVHGIGGGLGRGLEGEVFELIVLVWCLWNAIEWLVLDTGPIRTQIRIAPFFPLECSLPIHVLLKQGYIW